VIRLARPRTLRPVVIAVVAWLVGAATAVTVGVLALSIVGADLFGPADPLAQAAAPVPSPDSAAGTDLPRPGTSSAPAADAERTFTLASGTVVARCVDGAAYLVLWSPAPGFRAEDVTRGPAAVTRVKFETRGQEIKVTVRCVDGVPQSQVDEDE
jgi:hypothetical protein